MVPNPGMVTPSTALAGLPSSSMARTATSSAKVDDGGEAAPRSDAWPKADPPANYGGVDDFAVINDSDDLPF